MKNKLNPRAAKTLLALRAGEMGAAELDERFPSGSSISDLVNMGYASSANFTYKITEAGKKACPLRRDILKPQFMPDIPAPKPIKKERPAMSTEKPRTLQILEYIEAHPNCTTKELSSNTGTDSIKAYISLHIQRGNVIFERNTAGSGGKYQLKVGMTAQQVYEFSQTNKEATEPATTQSNDATPPVKKQPAEPMQQAMDPCAVIEIKFAIQLPDMPDRLKLTGLRKASLDDAIASGDGYMIDVATLDDNAVESLCTQWAQKFKAHVQSRKQLA